MKTMINECAMSNAMVGECLDADHPTLIGRVMIRWTDGEGVSRTGWVPSLQGLSIRVGDRVLLQQPIGWSEPIVSGVIDGFAARKQTDKSPAASLILERDEAITVLTKGGERLLEVYEGDEGTVIRLLREDVDVSLDGRLSLSAKAIRLAAQEGSVQVEAHDDVIVDGETIRLN